AAAHNDRDVLHPAALSVRQFGCTEQLLWVGTPEHRGRLLSHWYGPGIPRARAAALAFLRYAAPALSSLHGAGLVHGALGSSAFHRGVDGTVRVRGIGVDLPIVRFDAARGRSTETALCLAPEVRDGCEPSPASDQYELAALLVRILTGRAPAGARGLASERIPREWRAALARALSAAPARRFPTVDDRWAALDADRPEEGPAAGYGAEPDADPMDDLAADDDPGVATEWGGGARGRGPAEGWTGRAGGRGRGLGPGSRIGRGPRGARGASAGYDAPGYDSAGYDAPPEPDAGPYVASAFHRRGETRKRALAPEAASTSALLVPDAAWDEEIWDLDEPPAPARGSRGRALPALVALGLFTGGLAWLYAARPDVLESGMDRLSLRDDAAEALPAGAAATEGAPGTDATGAGELDEVDAGGSGAGEADLTPAYGAGADVAATDASAPDAATTDVAPTEAAPPGAFPTDPSSTDASAPAGDARGAVEPPVDPAADANAAAVTEPPDPDAAAASAVLEPAPQPVPAAEPPPADPGPTTEPEPAVGGAPVDVPAGTLSLQSYPWGDVYLDGTYVGTTPLLDLRVPAGLHTVRIVRDGYDTYVSDVSVEPGRSVRLTGIVLRSIGR
ncbi:MAG TPA: PEGA domain-containing protein, partial [Longimicrobiales bacterium]|nr:PEGA domain-containing protein [Longimicrobiales bacterium]